MGCRNTPCSADELVIAPLTSAVFASTLCDSSMMFLAMCGCVVLTDTVQTAAMLRPEQYSHSSTIAIELLAHSAQRRVDGSTAKSRFPAGAVHACVPQSVLPAPLASRVSCHQAEHSFACPSPACGRKPQHQTRLQEMDLKDELASHDPNKVMPQYRPAFLLDVDRTVTALRAVYKGN